MRKGHFHGSGIHRLPVAACFDSCLLEMMTAERSVLDPQDWSSVSSCSFKRGTADGLPIALSLTLVCSARVHVVTHGHASAFKVK
ncbi:hypothetical protein EYF80_046428 [Liparis tanakae]|uniref:Uncharacterized protein n=1 Tax=Liparis tanakae TaxID=230148 RepID=A0A4Z2FQ74_9TELE|nr:hypothetical protein EYF80_046428 [Liparis tanakae]